MHICFNSNYYKLGNQLLSTMALCELRLIKFKYLKYRRVASTTALSINEDEKRQLLILVWQFEKGNVSLVLSLFFGLRRKSFLLYFN